MREILHNILLFLALTKPRGMLCPNGTVKPFLVSLVEPVAYLKSELIYLASERRLEQPAEHGRTVMAVARRQSANQFGIDLPESVSRSSALGPEKRCARELPAGEAGSALGGSFSAAVWREHTHLLC